MTGAPLALTGAPLAAAALVAAAALLALPHRTARARLRLRRLTARRVPAPGRPRRALPQVLGSGGSWAARPAAGSVASAGGPTAARTAASRPGVREGDRPPGAAAAPVAPVPLVPVLVPVVAGLGWWVAGPVAGLVVGTYATVGLRAARARARARQEARARAAGVDCVAGLAADLRAGLVGAQALGTAVDGLLQLPGGAADPVGLRCVQAAARDGGDVPAALRAVRDDVLGPLVLRRLAAAWSVGDGGGAPLGATLDRLEQDVVASARAEQRAAAETAAARSTSRLLAGLPVVGLALGYALGADPVAVLLHTPVGSACTALALALQLAGLAWSARLARPVVR